VRELCLVEHKDYSCHTSYRYRETDEEKGCLPLFPVSFASYTYTKTTRGVQTGQSYLLHCLLYLAVTSAGDTYAVQALERNIHGEGLSVIK